MRVNPKSLFYGGVSLINGIAYTLVLETGKKSKELPYTKRLEIVCTNNFRIYLKSNHTNCNKAVDH